MKKINAIIVDDERAAQETLCSLIKKFVPFVKVVGVASGLQDAKTLLASMTKIPELVFLDIQLGKDIGLEFIASLSPTQSNVVITSAYSSYGLDAAKKGVRGYLEKPIDVDELTEICVQIAQQKQNKDEINKLLIPTKTSYEIIDPKDIEMLEGKNNYTLLYLRSKQIIIASKSLKYFEDQLSTPIFFRAHKSYIINLNHVVRLSKGEPGSISMQSRVKALLSRQKKKAFLSLLF
ncbi:MAG: LytTR family DNA-binding domain-containing protein [Bacteroidota bacterium]